MPNLDAIPLAKTCMLAQSHKATKEQKIVKVRFKHNTLHKPQISFKRKSKTYLIVF